MTELKDKAMAEKNDSLVIIPMYNEKENAAAIIDAVLKLDTTFDILVIDDNSPDGTADIVKAKIKEHPGRVNIIERAGKLGLGTAYITGFKWALENGYEYICEMDADFSHNPLDLEKLRHAVASGQGDVAVGSRYVTGVNVVNWPMGRVLMSYYASKYVRFVTRMPVHDTTAGFVCYRRAVLSDIDLDAVRFKGYAFQIEMKFTAHQLNYKVTEVPIIFVNRVLGTSKMSSGIFGEALFGVIRLKWSSIFNKKHRLSEMNKTN
jgi:dolichol-phosphate mannosyltransferase